MSPEIVVNDRFMIAIDLNFIHLSIKYHFSCHIPFQSASMCLQMLMAYCVPSGQHDAGDNELRNNACA